MRRNIITVLSVVLMAFAIGQMSIAVQAEQSGSSPESGTTSRIVTAYDFLVGKGSNYGVTDAGDWTNSWGTHWNRIMEAAAWEPDGTGTAAEVPSGLTFYAGSDNRTQKTGTLYQNWELQDYNDQNCANNNGETNTACGAGDSESVNEEGGWTLVASGGTPASVTDNAVSQSLASNKIYRDNRTMLSWTDRSANALDNEFAFVDGNDRSSPAGSSCNFNATGTANAFCDNQDPGAGYTEDNDVSAAEFCLNLQVDADNADGDSNGLTGVETNWRLPTQKEQMIAYVNGSANNWPNPQVNSWSSTEDYSSQVNAVRMVMGDGLTTVNTKTTGFFVFCVRRS
jgi:hypothetical protein